MSYTEREELLIALSGFIAFGPASTEEVTAAEALESLLCRSAPTGQEASE